MKHTNKKTRWWLLQEYFRNRKREQRDARARHRAQRRRTKYRQLHPVDEIRRAELRSLIQRRTEIIASLYGYVKYNEAGREVKIVGDFGLEDLNHVDAFLDTASSFVDSRSRHLYFDLRECTRVWPTAVTLLCSMRQWNTLTSTSANRQIIGNGDSEVADVNAYLAHCGFCDYVGRRKSEEVHSFSDDSIVKIHNEMSRANVRPRAQDVINLLRRYGRLDDEQLEHFVSQVLFEVLLNITEHGFNARDQGWWMIGQYHKTHQFISLCFADNGIGIRNSLMSGPQYREIQIKDEPEMDGEFIKLAMSEVVTGAVDRRYPSGVGRGRGLKKVVHACRELEIPFSILSHHGYAFMGGSNSSIHCGSREGRIFAGTMHHFIVDAKRIEEIQ